jgi:hypothetical protein
LGQGLAMSHSPFLWHPDASAQPGCEPHVAVPYS